MPTTMQTRKSSRVGRKNYKSPPKLRFKDMKGAKKFIRANKLRVTEHISHSRGHRLQVVDRNGKARTISVESH